MRAHIRFTLHLTTAAVAVVLVSGCDTWFGKRDGPPLPGDRISVMVHERVLKPDQGTEGTKILLPAPTLNRAWPQAGGYANHAMHHIKIGDVIGEAWDASIGQGSDDEERFVGTPVVGDGRIFAIDAESQVTALDSANGNELWQVELTPDEEDDGHIGGGLAYEAGRVFATTGFAQVIALDAATGAIIWRKTVGGPMRSAPTVHSGRVFAITVDNRLHALAAEDGRALWNHDGITETASLLGGASPAVDQGVVVAPYSSGELVAMKVENGQVLWDDSLASMYRIDEISTLSHIRGRPVMDRGLVIAMSHGEVMLGIDLRSGRRIWERRIGGIESPWVAGDYVYTLTSDAELVCLGRKDGRVFWVAPLPRFEDPEDLKDPIVWSGPILVSDRLIVTGSHGWAMTVSPYTGALLSQQEMPDAVSVAPVVADGTLYFLSDDATLTAYR